MRQNPIDYINKLKIAELNDKQITAIAEILTDIEEKQKLENATKKDIELAKLELEKKIESSKNQVILWVAGLVMASGLIQHFFK